MDHDATADINAPHSMGTTIIGVTYNGGVILGADSRTSTDYWPDILRCPSSKSTAFA
ncbi:proteasome subunit beta type-6, partial [Tanacetum coccineum]